MDTCGCQALLGPAINASGRPSCLKDPKSAEAVQALCSEVEELPVPVLPDSACWGGHLWRPEDILPTGNCGYHSRVGVKGGS